MKILITDEPGELEWHLDEEIEAIHRALPAADIDVFAYTTPDALRKHLADANGVLTSFVPFPADVLAAAKELKVISVKALGTDPIDLEAARRQGIAVRNVADYCTDEVADHTLALLLALARHLKPYDQRIQTKARGAAEVSMEHGLHRLAGQYLALFGWGHIGKAVARRAKAFGLHVLVVSSHLTTAEALRHGVHLVSKDEALREADIVSNHMRQTPDKSRYFAAEEFAAMKRRPIFLNTGRAAAVDETALLAALDMQEISAAGLDVFDSDASGPRARRLLRRDNVILTPHAAFYSEESERELFDQAIGNLLAELLPGTMPDPSPAPSFR